MLSRTGFGSTALLDETGISARNQTELPFKLSGKSIISFGSGRVQPNEIPDINTNSPT